MKHTAQIATLALALSLGVIPLAACGNSAATSETSASPTADTPSQSATVDTSSWTTMRDALAVADDDPNAISYGTDDKHFVCVIKSGDARIRAIATMDPSKQDKFADLDMGSKDYVKQLTDIIGDLKLESAQDVSADLMSQEALDAFVGKTGQDLIDAGFVFDSYSMYGGEQTGAEMGKGCFSYSVTFDAHTDESKTEDEGASIMGAKVVSIESFGNLSAAALDPEQAG